MEGFKIFMMLVGLYTSVVACLQFLAPTLHGKYVSVAFRAKQAMNRALGWVTHAEIGYFESLKVDLSLAHKKLETEVTQKLNEKLLDLDFDKETVQQVVDRLKLDEYANKELETALKQYIEDELDTEVDKIMDSTPPTVRKDIEPELRTKKAERRDDRVNKIMWDFGSSSRGIRAIVDSTVMQSRKEFFRGHADKCEEDLNEIKKFVTQTQADITKKRGDVTYWEDKAAEEPDETTKKLYLLEAERLKREIANLEKDVRDQKDREPEIEERRKKADGDSREYDRIMEGRKEDWAQELEHIKW